MCNEKYLEDFEFCGQGRVVRTSEIRNETEMINDL